MKPQMRFIQIYQDKNHPQIGDFSMAGGMKGLTK